MKWVGRGIVISFLVLLVIIQVQPPGVANDTFPVLPTDCGSSNITCEQAVTNAMINETVSRVAELENQNLQARIAVLETRSAYNIDSKTVLGIDQRLGVLEGEMKVGIGLIMSLWVTVLVQMYRGRPNGQGGGRVAAVEANQMDDSP